MAWHGFFTNVAQRQQWCREAASAATHDPRCGNQATFAISHATCAIFKPAHRNKNDGPPHRGMSTDEFAHRGEINDQKILRSLTNRNRRTGIINQVELEIANAAKPMRAIRGQPTHTKQTHGRMVRLARKGVRIPNLTVAPFYKCMNVGRPQLRARWQTTAAQN